MIKIQVIDKCNNKHYLISQKTSVVLHPISNETIVIDDYRRNGFYINGIIFHRDLTTEVLLRKIKK